MGITKHPAGTTWTYAGTRSSTPRGTTATSEAVTWRMSVVRTRVTANAELMLVRGFITELGWADANTKPKLSVLACVNGALWHYRAPTDAAADSAFAHWRPQFHEQWELLLKTPIHDGDLIGQPAGRSDRMYGWDVRALPRAGGPASCGSPDGAAYELTYSTNPDRSILFWRPGAIYDYRYDHHGTPMTVIVRLKSCTNKAPRETNISSSS